MRILFPGSIDTRKDIKLIGRIAAEYMNELQPVITAIFESFSRFVSVGGLCRVSGSEIQKLDGILEWNEENFIYTWSNLPFESAGLGIIFRMLRYKCLGKTGLDSVSIFGTPIEPSHPAAISELESIVSILPGRVQSLPFELEINPSGSWLTLECDLSPSFPTELPTALHEVIWCWGKVANAGGFQTNFGVEESGGNDAFGVGIDGPTVADDFLEWDIIMTGVPTGSLACLVNILCYFSLRHYPISSVYMK